MKKLGISMVALMIGLPMAARADIANATKVNIATNTNVATTSFVGGAYNALVDEINTNRGQINTNTTAIAGKQDTIDSTHKLDADLVDDSTSTNKFVTAAEKTAIANAITKDVNDLTNYTTTADMNTALGQKQDTIDSTHKLDADLVDDSTSTNKFVTAAEKTAIANAITKDVNDLTNYTTTADMNTALNAKANSADLATVATSGNFSDLNNKPTTVAGYGITDAYTKTEVNTAIEGSANTAEYDANETYTAGTVGAAIKSLESASSATKGFAVHGTWGSPTTATGHVNVVDSSTLNP